MTRLRLPHDETDETLRYTMPDPGALQDSLSALYWWRWGNGPQPTPAQISDVLWLAEGYTTLTTHELGQEHCVKKLRAIWRARRAR